MMVLCVYNHFHDLYFILFYYYCQYHHHYCCFCWEAGTDREINFAWGGLALDGYVCK